MEKGFSRHSIDQTGDVKGIVIKLGMPCIINRINMLLWDQDERAYSYYIDVSMDQKDWSRVVYHTRFHCRSWQYLYFPQRVVNFIRVVGTHNTVNKVFHVVTLEAMFTEQIETLDLGVIVPKTNVATLDASALVIEGVARTRNALLNGDTSNYDWDKGYTCHQLGSGAIVIQLGQPYALESMRLLLWDCDDRSYSYYIEVSNDQIDWEIVCDRTRERCKSWQVVRFNRRPVVFIRIVGTHNTENEVFHCVHFEAPAMGDVQDKQSASQTSTSHHSNITDDNVKDEVELAREISTSLDDLCDGNLHQQVDGAVGGPHRNPLQGLSVNLPDYPSRSFDISSPSVNLAGRGLNPPFLNLGRANFMARSNLHHREAAGAPGSLQGAPGSLQGVTGAPGSLQGAIGCLDILVDGLEGVALPAHCLQQLPQDGEEGAGDIAGAGPSGRGNNNENATNNSNHQLQGLHGAVPLTSSRLRPNLRGPSLPDL